MVGQERAFNYPKHPLFRITPLLDRGFQTVQFDPYERVLVAKIRSGQYSSDLWDSNSFYLGYSERIGSPADRQVTAIPSRYRFTPAMAEEYRKEMEARKAEWKAQAPQRAQRALERAAEKAKRDAEWERIQREWAERRAEKVRLEVERAAEWVKEEAERKAERKAEKTRGMDEALGVLVGFPVSGESEQRLKERAKILAAPWQCKKCLKPAAIALHLGKYQLVCQPCAFSSVGDHETLIKLVEAQAA